MSDILLLVPFAALIALNLLPKSARGAAGSVCIALLFLQTATAAIHAFGLFDWSFLAPLERALGFNLQVDNLSVLLLISSGLAGMAALLVARPVLRQKSDTFTFANLLLVALIGMNGIAVVRDLFTLYVFIEVTAVSTFILIGLRHGADAFEGAWKYIILSAVASVFILCSIGLFLLTAGGVGFPAVAIALAAPGPLTWAAVALLLCGLFVKGGLVPFHGWIADAYTAAPAPVSIFMAGVVTKASGIFALIRLSRFALSQAAPAREVFLVVGALTIVVGAFLALGQSDMKRMLAYSSVSQIGYIVLALGGAPALGIVAAALHFFNHAVSKAQLFTNAAAIETQLGTLDMDRMGGIASRMPVTGATSAVASLSIAGLPPLAGFWSKLLIVIALWQAGQYAFAVVAILASLVTLAYFLSLQRRVFFGKTLPEWTGVREAGFRYIFPAALLALITVAIGLAFPFVLSILLGGGV